MFCDDFAFIQSFQSVRNTHPTNDVTNAKTKITNDKKVK